MTRVLGFDPAVSNNAGIAVIDYYDDDSVVILNSGVITYNKKLLWQERINILPYIINAWIEKHDPDFAAFEMVFTNKLLFVSGMFRGICESKGLLAYPVNPARMKKHVTGNGRASKQEVVDVVNGWRSKETDMTEDEADAVGVAFVIAKGMSVK